jgi:hypothetical protein
MVAINERYYIKATATIKTEKDSVSVCAYARESETKKGMDDSQITGTASSYARKYALNGLFLIDDTKDADTDEYHKKTNKAPKQPDKLDKSPQNTTHAKITEVQKDKITTAIQNGKLDLNGILNYYKVGSVDKLNHFQAQQIIEKKSL